MKRSFLAFLSPRLGALLRSSSSTQPRSQGSPSTGTDSRESWERVCSSQRILFTGLHYRNRVTLKIAYLLTSMSLHDYASVLGDLITLSSVYTSWQIGRFRMWVRDLSEISEGGCGGGGVGILHLGSEMRWPIPAIGVKFTNPPLILGLKYHDPPPLV